MPINCRVVTVLVYVTLVLAAPSAWGKALEDRRWIEVRTENFQVRSLLGDKETIELARNLEMFRLAVSAITNVSSTDSAIPTNIFAVRGAREFVRLGLLDRNVVGRFLPGIRNNTIVLRDTPGMSESHVILHEYTHFLVRNHGSQRYPMWYDEGLAEYLSTTRAYDTYFEIGLFAEHRKLNFKYSRWLPMRKVLSAEEHVEKWNPEQRSMFYAEAWALVHYLQNRPEAADQGLAHYLKLVEAGTDDVAAFEEAFGISVEKLDREITRYLNRGKFTFFRLDAADLLPEFQAEVVRLSRERISLALGQLALSMGKLDRAEHWLTIATAHEDTLAQAEAGLGDVLKFRGDFEAALPHFEKAVALAPGDPYCQLDLAEFWHDRAESIGEGSDASDYLNRAREHYVKAWRMDDSIPETYAMYGQTFQMEGQRFDKAIEMLEKAGSLLPSNLQIRLMLAEAYADAGLREDAVDAAQSVLVWTHSEDAIKKANEILTRFATTD